MQNGSSAIPTQPSTPTPAASTNTAQFGDYSNWAQQELSKGATVEQLQQTLQQHGINPTQGSAATTGGSQPSWWEKLLPTAGGIVGGILGVPGDLLSGGAASVGGAALGGAAGQSLENLITHKNPIQANDVSSGIENGAGELVGEGVSKLFGAGAKAITGALGKTVEGRAADAATQAATDQASKDATDQLASKNGEIQRVADEFKVQPGTGDLATHSQDAVSGLNALGYDKPMASDAVNVGNVVTGTNKNGPGILNMAKQQVLKDAGGEVNVGQVGDATTPSGKLMADLGDPSVKADLGDVLDPNGQSAASGILSKYNSLVNGVAVPAGEGTSGMTNAEVSLLRKQGYDDASIAKMENTSGESAPAVSQGKISPAGGFKLLSDVGDQARYSQMIADKAGATTADQAKAKVWSNLQANLKDSLYNRPEVNDAVANFKTTPELESQIDDKIKAEGITDPNVATNLKQGIVNTLNSGQQMSDWLSEEREGVLMGKVGNSALKQQGNVAAASTQRLAKGEAAAEAKAAEPDMDPATDKKGSKILDMAAVGAAPLTHGFSLIGLTPICYNLLKILAYRKEHTKPLRRLRVAR